MQTARAWSLITQLKMLITRRLAKPTNARTFLTWAGSISFPADPMEMQKANPRVITWKGPSGKNYNFELLGVAPTIGKGYFYEDSDCLIPCKTPANVELLRGGKPYPLIDDEILFDSFVEFAVLIEGECLARLFPQNQSALGITHKDVIHWKGRSLSDRYVFVSSS